MLSHIVYTFHIMIVMKFSAGIVYRKTYPLTTLSTKLLSHYFETEMAPESASGHLLGHRTVSHCCRLNIILTHIWVYQYLIN
jgi:hypothetical protein